MELGLFYYVLGSPMLIADLISKYPRPSNKDFAWTLGCDFCYSTLVKLCSNMKLYIVIAGTFCRLQQKVMLISCALKPHDIN